MRKTLFLLIIQFLFLQTAVLGQVFYTVVLGDDNSTYTVKLRPEESYPSPLNSISSFQVAFRVPSGGFKVGNLTNINGSWVKNGDFPAPVENPDSDYITFELSGGKQNIDFVAGQETELFSFQNIGECTGTLDFVASDDLFWPPNSENANIGNLVSVLGAGPGNAYAGPFGPPANCLMSQSGNNACEVVDSILTTNPRECGQIGGTITIFAQSSSGIPLRYSIDDGNTFQSSNVFTDLESATSYPLVIADEFGFCIAEHGVIELGPPSDAIIIRTSSTPDSCETTNGTLAIEAAPVAPESILEYSIDEGQSWHENDGIFTGLSAGTYLPRVRLKDAPCHDETDEIVVEVACPDGGGTDNGNGNTGGGNEDCKYTYVLDADNGVFTVSVIASETIPVPQNTTATAQVTIKVPTGGFSIANFRSLVDGANFEENGRTDQPSEAPEFDYIVFGLTTLGTRAILYEAGVKIPLFTFENGGNCTDNQVFLMENFTDPFFPPNSANANVGQQITVAATGSDLSIICNESNEISDCGEDLAGTGNSMSHFSKDTLYVTLPVEETTTVCIGDELEIANGSIGTVALCNMEETVIPTLTDGSNCLDITTDDHFNQSETICIVHFDANDNSISDTTILILCPAVDLGADLNICIGETISLNPTGGTGNFTWITDGNISCTDCPNPEITPDGPTQYILLSMENENCKDSDTLMVDVSEVPTIDNVSEVQPADCQPNGQIRIDASGGQGPYRYSIDNGSTFQDAPVFDNLGAGTYTIVVANQDEICSVSASDEINLTIEGAPSIVDVNVTPPNECQNTLGEISVAAESTNPADVLEFSIDGGATWQATGEFTDLEEGAYNLAVRVQNSGCEAVFANNPIEISPSADLRFTTPTGDQMICSESDRTISLELTENIIDHSINGGPFENDVRDGNTLTFTVNPNEDGNLYSVSITGESGCTITEEFTLTLGEDTDLWDINIETTPASCDNNDGGISVTVNENNNGFTFCWEPNKASGPDREGLSSDSTYQLTVTGTSGCTVSFDEILTGSTCDVNSCNLFAGLDTLNAFIIDGQATACIPTTDLDLSEFQFFIGNELQNVQFGECMQTSVFYGYEVLFELGEAPFTLIEWSVNNDTLRNFEFSTIEELVVQMNQFDFQANWVLNEELKIIQGFSTLNEYGSLNVQPSGSSQIPELQLNTMNTMYQSLLLDDSRGINKYTIKDPLNDCEDDLYIKIQGLEDGMDTLNLVTTVNTPITNQCLNTEETGTENLTLTVCEGSEPSAGILNSIGDGDTDACFGYMPNTDFIGKDFFCLELCNGEICDTTIVQVTVNEEGLVFFTGFSPNNDGVNDVFTIKNIESFPENNVLIYNRWGNQIFQKENYTNDEGWDGTFSERISPDGVYFYMVKVMINGVEEIFTGPIMLSR